MTAKKVLKGIKDNHHAGTDGAMSGTACSFADDTNRPADVKKDNNALYKREEVMSKLFNTENKKGLYLVLSACFLLVLAASVAAIDIPTGKTSDDYVKEAQSHVKIISAEETKALMDNNSNTVLLDIRAFDEFKEHGWIEGRTVLPHGMVIFKIRDIVPNKDVPIVVYCKKGKRSALVAYQIQQMGYENVRYLDGGILTWQRKGLPTVTSGVSRIAEQAVVPEGEMPTGKMPNDFVKEASGLVKGVSPFESNKLMESRNVFLLDIRSQQEIESQGIIDGALVMEHGKVIFNIKKKVHDANMPLLVICKQGGRSALIAQQLQEMGYNDVHHIEGGIVAWKEAGLPVK